MMDDRRAWNRKLACDWCGAPLEYPRWRITPMAETSKARFASYGTSYYLCERCHGRAIDILEREVDR